MAVVLFSFVPISYAVLGNANLTNAFGQSAALIALAAATIWTLQGRALLQTAGLTVLTAIALLSHFSTFALLSTTLVVLTGLQWMLGGASMRGPARAILLATFIATILSVVLYYSHFGEVYQNLGRARVPPAAAAGTLGSSETIAGPTDAVPAPTPLVRRLAAAADLTVMSIGWPILILAGAGAWRVWLDGTRDRLLLLIAAMGITFLVFVAGAIVSPVNTSFERYAAEFVGRSVYAAYPAVVILAGRGAAWAWSAGALSRVASTGLVAAAVVGGMRIWLGWFA